MAPVVPNAEAVAALRRRRHQAGLTCQQLATRAGVSDRTVRRLLRGESWGWETAIAVAMVLRVELRVRSGVIYVVEG